MNFKSQKVYIYYIFYSLMMNARSATATRRVELKLPGLRVYQAFDLKVLAAEQD